MRVVRYHDYGSADVLQIDEVDQPRPDRDEVLVEMRAASVNRVDVMFRSGQYGDLPLPSIPGGDGAGLVTAVGEDVEAFERGDRVFASGMDRTEGGTFAEYAAIPAEKLVRLPENVSWTAGGAIGNVGATAWTTLEELAGIQAGDLVLIHGGSAGVGHAAVQIAAHSGAEVITTAGSEDARARLADLGASVALDYESDSLAEDILAATDGAGVDTILGHRLEEYLDLNLSVVTEGGTIISTMGHIPETNGRPLYNEEVTIQPLKMDNHPTRQPVLERLARLMRQDILTPIVANTYAFEDTNRAHQEILAGGYVGKLVVTP